MSYDETLAQLAQQADEFGRKRAAILGALNTLSHLSGATDQEKDEGMLRVIGAAMQNRLAEARVAGKAGWQDANPDELAARLNAKAQAGEYLDAAIYAAMCYVHASLAAAKE